jgi:hypothetical protein
MLVVRTTGWTVTLMASLALILAACTGDSDPTQPDERVVTEGTATEQAGGRPGNVRAADCPVTRGKEETWPGNWSELTYRTGPLRVALYPEGIAQATRDDVQEDGSIAIKFGWWRAVEGRLAIEGRRLDAPAPPVRAHIPTGYGRQGFQSTAVIFASPGCWEVTGTLGAAKLTFVTSVVGLNA